MSTPLINDALWTVIAPLLPPELPKPKGGRPRIITDRAALTGIVFVLKSGIPWEMLPQELGCGSGMTCWRRLRDWQNAAVGGAYIVRSSNGCRTRSASTGHGHHSIARACPLPGGRSDRQGPDQSREVGHQAAYRGGPQRCAIGGGRLGGQCARLKAARSDR